MEILRGRVESTGINLGDVRTRGAEEGPAHAGLGVVGSNPAVAFAADLRVNIAGACGRRCSRHSARHHHRGDEHAERPPELFQPLVTLHNPRDQRQDYQEESTAICAE